MPSAGFCYFFIFLNMNLLTLLCFIQCFGGMYSSAKTLDLSLVVLNCVNYSSCHLESLELTVYAICYCTWSYPSFPGNSVVALPIVSWWCTSAFFFFLPSAWSVVVVVIYTFRPIFVVPWGFGSVSLSVLGLPVSLGVASHACAHVDTSCVMLRSMTSLLPRFVTRGSAWLISSFALPSNTVRTRDPSNQAAADLTP